MGNPTLKETPRSTSVQLAREEFWEPPLGLCARVAEALLQGKTEQTSLTLFTPDLVDLSERSSLPVLACLRGEAGSLLGPAAFAKHGVIHVMDPKTGHGGAALLSDTSTPAILERGVPDRFARVMRVDLRERLKLGWRTGQLLVTALLFEHRSLRVRVKLAFPPRLAGVEFESHLDSQRARLSPNEGMLVPIKDPYRVAPEVPPGESLTLHVDPMQRYVEGFPLRLRGAFDIVFDAEIPPTDLPVRILVLSTSETRFRESVAWIPVSEARDGHLRGSFTLDIGAMLPPPSSAVPERLYIYAFCGAAFCGPFLTTRFDDTLVESPLA